MRARTGVPQARRGAGAPSPGVKGGLPPRESLIHGESVRVCGGRQRPPQTRAALAPEHEHDHDDDQDEDECATTDIHACSKKGNHGPSYPGAAVLTIRRPIVRAMADDLPVVHFETREALEAWLAEHGEHAPGVWLKLAKKGADAGSVSYDEAVELGLACGWIDGQKRALDADFWLQRFTPRAPRSRWSRINRDKAVELIEAGRMTACGARCRRAGEGRRPLGARVRGREHDRRCRTTCGRRSTRTPRPRRSSRRSTARIATRCCTGWATARSPRRARAASRRSWRCSRAASASTSAERALLERDARALRPCGLDARHRPQRHLAQEAEQHERDDQRERGDQEDEIDRAREALEERQREPVVGVLQERRVVEGGPVHRAATLDQLEDLPVAGGRLHLRVADDGPERGRRGGLRVLVVDVRACGREQDREEDRRAERAAEAAEELRRGARDADVARRHGVLRRERDRLHHPADADAEQPGADRRVPVGRVRAQEVHHQDADDHRRAADDREHLVAARARDHAARDDGRDDQPAHQRQHAQPRAGRRDALHDLQVEGQHRDAAEHRHADDEADRRGEAEDGVAEEAQRQQRVVADRALGRDEPEQAEHADRVTGEGAGRTPAPVAALLGDHEERDEADDQCEGARHVDAMRTPEVRDVQRVPHDDERHEADRDVDQEHPAPARDGEDARRAGEEPPDDRPDHARDAEHREDVALVAGPLAWRDDVADDRERERDEAAGTETLERAERGQHVHRRRERGRRGADQEDDDREHVERLATVVVRELPVQRRRDRRGDEVRRGDPGLHGEPVQVVADRPDRARDDRLVERGQEHAEHQPRQHGQDLPVREGLRAGVGRQLGGRGRPLDVARLSHSAPYRARGPAPEKRKCEHFLAEPLPLPQSSHGVRPDAGGTLSSSRLRGGKQWLSRLLA